MAYYIRKAFKKGPVRINLSKGGLGLSLGITGARVGFNKRGAYVHGGRHGLYYRKHLRAGSARRTADGRITPGSDTSIPSSATFDTSQSPTSAGAADSPSARQTVTIFHDTGATLGKPLWKSRKAAEFPSAPVPQRQSASERLFFLLSGLFTAIFAISGMYFANALAACVFVVLLYRYVSRTRAMAKVRNILETGAEALEQETDIESAIVHASGQIAGLPAGFGSWASMEFGIMYIRRAVVSEGISLRDVVAAIGQSIPLGEEDLTHILKAACGEILDELLENHVLSPEEAAAMEKLLDESGLGESETVRERELIAHYAALYEKLEQPLEPVPVLISLVRGEVAYAAYTPARILNERVQERFQRNNVPYRVIGYETELEGTAIITDRRVILTGRGAREYRLSSIQHVTADPDAGIVELVIRGRKSPVIFTMEEPLLFSAQLQKAIEMQAT